jgi:isopenicillin N synthase-like dioxygenase
VLTLIPASNVPALEILDQKEFLWHNVETQLLPSDLMVLCGETLEHLSACHYRSVVHRVQAVQQDRYSLVFLMRGKPEALLDPRKVQDGGEEEEKVISVANFMRKRYLKKKSANFVDPGQGLPLANLKGEALEHEELENWKSDDKNFVFADEESL